jgi:putative transposase
LTSCWCWTGSPKKIVGDYAGTRGTTQHWLAASNMAVDRQFPGGVREQGLSLMSNNGCQPTSIPFMEACAALGIHHTFTRHNNPKGNADTERAMRTLKEECLWLREWRCPLAPVNALETWIDWYNEQYLHSTPGYKPPTQFERESYSRHGPPFAAA